MRVAHVGRHRRLSCRHLVERVTDHLDGTLDPAAQIRVRHHLRACRHCAAYLSQVEAMVRALARVTPPPLDRAARDGLVGFYRQWAPTG